MRERQTGRAFLPAKYPTLPSILNKRPAVFANCPFTPIGYAQGGWFAAEAACMAGAAIAEAANDKLRIEVLKNFIFAVQQESHEGKKVHWEGKVFIMNLLHLPLGTREAWYLNMTSLGFTWVATRRSSTSK